MFIPDHLAVVSHWAKEQLRAGVPSREIGLQLKQLINAVDALQSELGLEEAPQASDNVVSIDAYRRGAR
jgi:hypothetical protein